MEIKRFYDEFAKQPLNKRSNDRYVLRLKKSASLGKSGNVLDVGCRNGVLRKLLPRSSYVGVDITPKWRDARFDFVVADATHLPFKSSAFDNVFALEILEHLFDPNKFIKEVHRCIKNNGTLILSTPNIVCLLNRFKVLFGKLPSYFGSDSGHLHCYTYNCIVEMLTPLFKIIKREPTYVLLPLRRLTNSVPMTFLKLIAQLYPNLCDHVLVNAEVVK